MTKIVLELQNEPFDNCMILYDKKKGWYCVSKEILINETLQLRKEYLKTLQELKEYKEKVNEKLKEYHDILQVLAQRED